MLDTQKFAQLLIRAMQAEGFDIIDIEHLKAIATGDTKTDDQCAMENVLLAVLKRLAL